MKEEFFKRAKIYFGSYYDEYINKLNEKSNHGFYINSIKDKKENILKMIDFDYKESLFNELSFKTNNDAIGKSIAYELGLIYPQDSESSFFITKIDKTNPKIIVDMCAAPGGKTIDTMNKYPDALFICNDINYKRATILSSNLERLGLDNCIISNKSLDELANILYGNADIVILDAPCSGEGMIRKYPEILDNYSTDNIKYLSNVQNNLLENAYNMLNEDGILIYSTCTYAFEENEDQITNFLNKHKDMLLIPIDNKINISKLNGTVKLSPINDLEGQFISIIKRVSINETNRLKALKTVKNKIVENFIKENINISNYYLYEKNNLYYISLRQMIDLGNNVLRNGIFMGELKKDRFEPAHSLYRSKLEFKKSYECNDDEYIRFISGNEIKIDLNDGYYQIKYKGYPIGFGKIAKGILKNKYPKGLRRVIK